MRLETVFFFGALCHILTLIVYRSVSVAKRPVRRGSNRGLLLYIAFFFFFYPLCYPLCLQCLHGETHPPSHDAAFFVLCLLERKVQRILRNRLYLLRFALRPKCKYFEVPKLAYYIGTCFTHAATFYTKGLQQHSVYPRGGGAACLRRGFCMYFRGVSS